MKFLLFLMNEKGLSVLTSLIEKGYHSSFELSVIIGIDKNVQNDYSSEMTTLCKDNGVSCYDRKFEINYSSYDYFVAVGWRWIIPVKDEKLIVFHDSLLPRYRGFSPLVNALINGEEYIGVTALWATLEFDKGKIILQDKIKITYPIKISRAINLISRLYVSIILKIFENLKNSVPLLAVSQNEEDASYSLWRDEKDYFLDWSLPSQVLKRTIDALGFPFLGARSLLNGVEVSICEAEVVPDLKIENRDIGKLLLFDEGFPVIVCGTGLLKLISVKSLNGESVEYGKYRSRFH